MATAVLYITSQGRRKLEDDVRNLENYRRILSRQINDTWRMDKDRDMATTEILAEEYVHTKSQLEKIVDILTHAVDIRHHRNHRRVELGSQVALKDETGRQVQYKLVGTIEADPGRGLISNESPVGKALMGKTRGQSVDFTDLSGNHSWKIEAVA